MKGSLTVILTLCFTTGLFAQHDQIAGVWYDQDKRAKIEIFKEGDKFFGKTIWVKEPNSPDGQPLTDKKNPDAKLRTQPIIELVIIKNLAYNEKSKKWEGGTVYDPESGNTYKIYMWFEGNQTDALNLRGYLGVSLLGRNQIWTRTTK